VEAVPPAQVPAAPSTAAGTSPKPDPAPADFTARVWQWLREPDELAAWQLWHDLPDGGR
jgi:hypothetical protein